MTFIYGDPVLERQEQVREHLTRFTTLRNGSWFMISDFNEITWHNEKEGDMHQSDSSFFIFEADAEWLWNFRIFIFLKRYVLDWKKMTTAS